MSRLLIELTNRCNLRCRHCFEQRHGNTSTLPLPLVDRILREAPSAGVQHVSFTGGEPSLHPAFLTILDMCHQAGCTFSFVSNGSTFPRLYRSLLHHGDCFRGVTFSLDGARESTHGRLRGTESYRQVMRAAAICNFTSIPFTFNMVVTAENRGELADLVQLAADLGCGGVRFGYLMPGHGVDVDSLALSPSDHKTIAGEIRELQRAAPISVRMGPGYYSDEPFFPCGPLELEEFNVDSRGYLTLCCQMSGYWGHGSRPDAVANLSDVSLVDACNSFRERVATYLADKRDRVDSGTLSDIEHFPCVYCVRYLAGTAHPLLVHKHAHTPRTDSCPT
jgi:MoaA/NifB/PqqE/SkfB family radical SAM enzyme